MSGRSDSSSLYSRHVAGAIQLMVLPTFFLAATWPLAAQGGTFTRLNRRDINAVTGISADGKIIVGTLSNSGPAFRWTAETGVVEIGGSGFRAVISRDGKTIVSNARDSLRVSQAAIWQSGTNWKVLGGVPGGQAQRDLDGGLILSNAWGVSGDGAVIVGLGFLPASRAHGFRCDAQNGMVDLGTVGVLDSRASAVSGDGNVTVGFDVDIYQSFTSGIRGAIWWQGSERLLHAFGWIGEALGVNAQGSIIVGTGAPLNLGHAYIYTSWDGKVEDMGAIPRGFLPGVKDREDVSRAFAVSDTMVAVGSSGFQPPLDAFIWFPDTKMLKLSAYLANQGVTGIDGWRLLEATAITPDGKGITGNCNRSPGRS